MFRSMLIILILAIMPLTCLCQLRPPDRGEVLTLEEAITLAIRGNPAIKKAELDIEISSDRLAAAATRRLPSFEVNLLESQTLTRLDFRFPRGIFGTYPSTGPVPNEDTTIGTSRQPTTFLYARAAQPISQLHRINLGLKLEEIRRESAREKLRSEKQSVTRDVKRIYYDLIGLQSALENVEENIRLYRELDRVVGEQVAQKVALKADSLEVKTQIAAQEYSSLTLRNSLASQKEQFNLLLGRDVETDFRVSALTDGTMIEVDLAAARAGARSKAGNQGSAVDAQTGRPRPAHQKIGIDSGYQSGRHLPAHSSDQHHSSEHRFSRDQPDMGAIRLGTQEA
ncbi:MAG: TolC family protein [Acidobacteria bacterium]|nr:TolC family protein [Acidobacteriota bacterium]